MPTCQGQHPDGSPCHNPAPEGQARCYIHRRPDPAARLTPEDVLKAIEERGGPEELDLSREDLQGAHLGGADLQGARLSRANLQGAKLWRADHQGADLRDANLQGADLEWANLQGADLWRANLQGADLEWARLERVDLTGAKDLTKIRWYGAVLDKTRMLREQLGEKIGDELAAERGDCPYDVACEAYLALKTNFNELGRYDDASWAYRKERRMERAMYGPSRWEWWWDGVAEWLTDYGESPGRVLGWAALLLLVVYPIIYDIAAGGRPPWEAPLESVLAFVSGYPDNLLLSLGSFSTLDVVNLSAAGAWTRLWAATEAMAGISLLALLMFTLGNRISRS